MKTKIKRHSRSALSILLTVCMLISCMTVGLIATDAARANSGTVASNGTAVNRTVYVKQSAVSSTTYSDYRVWFAHTDNNLINELITMTDTGKTIGDDKVYSATIYDIYDGLNKIYFQAFDDDSWAAQTKAVDKWTKYSIYNGKVWNGSSWEVPNWDTVYGVTGCTELTGDDWGVTNSENDMTKSGSSYTKTYNDIPAGSYEFKITKDHDSVALITINTQAVFYGNNNIVPVEAFYNCSSLEKIELSANLKSIQSNAFAGCTSLKYLVLFDTVTYIAPNAFDGDDFLKAVRKFMEMDSLTAPMLRELIDHIDVHEKEGGKKNYTQRIVIYYRFVGYLELPSSEDENYKANTRKGVDVEYIPTAKSA